jgi:hypothetical protein
MLSSQTKKSTTQQQIMQQINALSYSTVSVVPDAGERPLLLSSQNQPNEFDIVCKRGGSKAFAEQLPGTQKFSLAIRHNFQRYFQSRRKLNNSIIVAKITSSLRDAGIRFIKLDQESQCYYEISEDQAHGKLGRPFASCTQS